MFPSMRATSRHEMIVIYIFCSEHAHVFISEQETVKFTGKTVEGNRCEIDWQNQNFGPLFIHCITKHSLRQVP